METETGDTGVLTLSGFAAGTHELAIRSGDARARALVDTVPRRVAEGRLPVVWRPPPLVETRTTRLLCVLTNSLDDHSQNAIFATASEGLVNRGNWRSRWFVPKDHQSAGVRLRHANVVEVEDLRLLDWAEARRRRLDGDASDSDRASPRFVSSENPAFRWLESRPAVSDALKECDVHWYANTFDDPDVAALAELAATAAPNANRVADLPNLPPPVGMAADAYVAPSKFAASQLGVLSGLESPLSQPVGIVYPAALNTDDFKNPQFGGSCRGERETTTGRRRRELVVGYLGRLAPERSPGLFVRAVALLRRDPRFLTEGRFPGEDASNEEGLLSPEEDNAPPSVRAVVMGDGPLREALEKEALRLGAGIRFQGLLNRSEVADWLKTVDVLLQPRPGGETFGVANAEAAAAGATVVAYAKSGAAESAFTKSSVLVDSTDPEAYARAAGDALFRAWTAKNPPTCRVPARFTADVMIDGYQRLLSAAASSLTLATSPLAAYAAPLVATALKRAWGLRSVKLADLVTEPTPQKATTGEKKIDVALVGCLDGGCAEGWTWTCVERSRQLALSARHQGARAVLFVCGEAWDLTPIFEDESLPFDAVLAATTLDDRAVHLPVAATAFSELRKSLPGDVAVGVSSPFDQFVPTTKQGVAYLYFRCRPERESFFAALSDAGVRPTPLGNCGRQDTEDPSVYVQRRFAPTWHDDAVEAYKPFKFVVAFENSDAPGYLTEKMALAFLAGAVPVYLGHTPTATRVFNSSAFIDCGTMPSLKDCAKKIARLDRDHTAYAAVRAAPPLTDAGLAVLRADDLHLHLAQRLAHLQDH